MSTSTATLLVELYEQQVTLLQDQIQRLKQHLANPGAEVATAVPVATGKDGKKKKGSKKDPSAEPKKKRPLSGFQLFMKEQLHEKKTGGDVNNNPKETLTRISKVWKEISDTDRGVYNKRAEKLKQDGVVVEPAPVAASSSSSSLDISTPASKKSEKKRKADPEPAVVAAPIIASPVAVKKSDDAEDREGSHHKKKKKHHKHDSEKKKKREKDSE